MASANDEHQLVVREVEFELVGDGRTIEALIVPYNTVARVSDPPDFEPYEERWLPGAFSKQTNAPDRVKVWLTFEHEQGLRGIVGHGVKLVEREDGLYGTFRVHSNSDGDKALQLINDGITQGLSLEATPLRTRINGGVVERMKASLKKVGLTWKPAYPDAQVLAVREEPDEPEEPAPDPQPEPDSEKVTAPEPEVLRSDVAEALQRMGYERVVVGETTSKPWDSSLERFTDEECAYSALVVREGDEPVKERCSLLVFEPTGELNVNALRSAAVSVHSMPKDERAPAARKLVRLYRQAGITAPPRLVSLASR